MIVKRLAGLNCPNCGAAVELRTFGQAITATCPNCHSVLDVKDPNLAVLQQAQSAQAVQLLVPLGSRGTFEDASFEAIGFQVRTVYDPEDGPDSWQEYLLYNPYRGYRYITEYQGHWNLVHILRAIPEIVSETRVRSEGANFQVYSRATAQTSYVIGEFPWAVRVGDRALVADYISVPRILSSETSEQETVWSTGGYLTGPEVWNAFRLPGGPPAARGVFANQPSPHAASTGLWGTAWKLVAAAFVLAVLLKLAGGHQVYREGVTLASSTRITDAFEVSGHESNLEIEAKNRGSESFYLHYALVDQASGQARSFSRSIGAEDRAVVPDVKPGRYALRMEAEQPGANFDLIVRRNVPSLVFFWLVGVLLVLPPLAQTWQRSSFERSRWQGSSR